MKKLTDYKKDIHRCSKCGLCQSVCPIYQITGNDCAVSRGKFIMLNGVLKGDLELNKNINKYLDMCLKCNACKNFCPSGIDARKIFLAAKAQYFQKCPEKKIISFLQSEKVFNLFLKMAGFASNVYRALNFDKLVKKFYPLLNKKCCIQKKIILANEFVSEPNPKLKKNSLIRLSFPTKQKSVVYFKGCVNEHLNPRAKAATEYLLNCMGVEILPIDFQCCGVPFLSSGNVQQYKKQALLNISQIPDDYDYFLTDCASCQNAFKEYSNYIDDEVILAKLDKINQKSINVMDYILKNIKSVHFDKSVSFTFHKPCHLEDMSFINELLSKCENVDYKEMKDFDKCCGFSGEFAIKNPKLSSEISAKKAQNAIAAQADYVLTSCPACLLGISQGMIEISDFTPAMNIVEFLALADKIVFKKPEETTKNSPQTDGVIC